MFPPRRRRAPRRSPVPPCLRRDGVRQAPYARIVRELSLMFPQVHSWTDHRRPIATRSMHIAAGPPAFAKGLTNPYAKRTARATRRLYSERHGLGAAVWQAATSRRLSRRPEPATRTR